MPVTLVQVHDNHHADHDHELVSPSDRMPLAWDSICNLYARRALVTEV